MKKLLLVIGAGIGFILGSKSGRQPYERLEQKVRDIRARPEVQDSVDSVTKAAHEQVSNVNRKVAEKMPA
jgi:hypothetical protein